jgi:hypothetical protein
MPPMKISAGFRNVSEESAFPELDHQLIRHPKSQPGAAAHKLTAHRDAFARNLCHA